MTSKELKLAAHFLQEARDEFANHGCNDVPESVWKDWTIEERQRFIKEYHEYNGDTEEYNPSNLHVEDWAIMAFLSHKLNNA
jgi:hypothetical protein